MIQVAGALVAVYLLILAVMFFFQREMIYFPNVQRPDPVAAGVPDFATVTYRTVDGLDLIGWYQPAREDRPTILYFHGNGGNIGIRGRKALPFVQAGFGVLLAEYRGYGGNPGSPSEDGLYRDGDAAAGFLMARGVSPSSIVLYGESLGSGVAVDLAHRLAARGTPVKAVALEAPYTALPDVAAGHYPWLPVRLLMRDRFRSIDKIATIGAPVFIAHGEQDRIIPIALAKRLFEAAPEPKAAFWPPSATHVDLHLHGVAEATVAFVDGLNLAKRAP